MRLATIAATSVVATSVASASASSAKTPNRLFARELSVLTDRGLSRAHASRALAVEDAIAKTDLVARMEAAMGRAWGGAWFDPATARLHVGAVARVARAAATAVAARAALTANVEVTRVRSSWRELLAAQKRWNRRLTKLFARAQVMTSLDARHDALVVTLSSSVAKAQRAALARSAASAGVNVIVLGVNKGRIDAQAERETTCKFEESKARCSKPLTSGVTIETAAGAVRCTAGPMVIPAESKLGTYVLTAGHCIKLSGLNEKWFALTPEGTALEIGKSVKFTFALTGDFGDIQINEPGNWAELGNPPVFALLARWGVKTEKSFPVIGKVGPVENVSNCHVGQRTGESCGTIGLTSISFGVNDKEGEAFTKIDGLVEDVGSTSNAGDSGGPWFFINEHEEIFMEGTHVTKMENGNPVYMPLEETLSTLKMELLTTADEVRPTNPLILTLAKEKISELRFKGEGVSGGVKEGGTFESVGKKSIKCTAATTEASFTAAEETNASQGTAATDFTGCKMEKIACRSENSKGEKDPVETALASLGLRFASEKSSEGVLKALLALRVLSKEGGSNLTFLCGLVRVEIKGIAPCLAIPNSTEIEAGGSIEVLCKQKEGKQETSTCQETKAACKELEENPLLGDLNGKTFEGTGFAIRIEGSFNKMIGIDA